MNGFTFKSKHFPFLIFVVSALVSYWCWDIKISNKYFKKSIWQNRCCQDINDFIGHGSCPLTPKIFHEVEHRAVNLMSTWNRVIFPPKCSDSLLKSSLPIKAPDPEHNSKVERMGYYIQLVTPPWATLSGRRNNTSRSRGAAERRTGWWADRTGLV